MRLAAIDLGSNTVKMTIADRREDGGLDVVEERADITRIGQGLGERGALLPEAIDRTLAALTAYVEAGRALGVDRWACVATAGLRAADDAGTFVARAREALGLEVEIIGGHREAELAYRAPAAMFGPGNLVVVDVGGRSTEIVVGRGPSVVDRASLEVGGVRLTELLLPTDPPTAGELAALEAHIERALADAPAAPADATVVGVSGTVLSLMGVFLGLDDLGEAVRRGDGGHLPATAIRTIFEQLAAQPARARLRGTVISEGRADVIVAGAAIVLAVCSRYRAEALRVTNRGVRFGLLAEMAEAARLSE